MVEVTYADLTAAAATQTLNIGPTAAKQAVLLEFARLVVPFVSSDGTLISTAITVGDTGSATRFLASMELNAAGSFVNMKAGALGNPTGLFVYTSADTLQIAVAGTSAKLLNTHTAGKLLLFFTIMDGRVGQGATLSGTGNN
jgi:hypothetical protein